MEQGFHGVGETFSNRKPKAGNITRPDYSLVTAVQTAGKKNPEKLFHTLVLAEDAH